MPAFEQSDNWQLALDLLIARAALDAALAEELTNDLEACCNKHGVEIPSNVKLVISKPEQQVIVKTIPGDHTTEFKSIPSEKTLVGSTTYNSGVEETVTNTTSVEEAEVTTTEAQTAETTTTVGAEAEAVVVIVAT